MAGHGSLNIILCDQDEDVVRAWEEEFAGYTGVSVRYGDFFDIAADAYVSPANSFGIMDGGLDLALRDYFGYEIQERVEEAIQGRGGRLAVGEAVIVPTGDEEIPYLIVAPTMERPSNVAYTNNAYDAMTALLGAVQTFNEEHPGEIETVAVPGLCTGIGGMEPAVAAQQMREAYDQAQSLNVNPPASCCQIGLLCGQPPGEGFRGG